MQISVSTLFTPTNTSSLTLAGHSSLSQLSDEKIPTTLAPVKQTQADADVGFVLYGKSGRADQDDLAAKPAIFGSGDSDDESQQSVKSDEAKSNPTSQKTADESQEDRKRIQELAARDREVHAHEAAHAAAGGQYTGAPSYEYERGPDGRSYAVAGEVAISVSAVADDPEATLKKAQAIQRAALAPAEPSEQDRQVAAAAAQLEAQARADLFEQKRLEAQAEEEARKQAAQESSNSETESTVESIEVLPTIAAGDAAVQIDGKAVDADTPAVEEEKKTSDNQDDIAKQSSSNVLDKAQNLAEKLLRLSGIEDKIEAGRVLDLLV